MIAHLLQSAKQHPSSVFILLLLYLLDRVSKLVAVSIEPNITLIESLIRIRLVFNERIIFFVEAMPWVDILIGSVVLFLLWMYVAFTIRELRGIELFLFLVVAIGAWSNISDRIWYAGVIDFIEVPFWSIFNIADIYIVGGAIVLLYLQFSDPGYSVEKPSV